MRERQLGSEFSGPDDPVFASSNGTWLWPNNIRTRLRSQLKETPALVGITPHTLRRTVGTLIAHERSLDAAREVLGHSDPSVTYQAYTAKRVLTPDVRALLDTFFTDGDAGLGSHLSVVGA